MEIRELKAILDSIDPDQFMSDVFVIVGTPEEQYTTSEGRVARRPARGFDIGSAQLSFDNGGPVFVLTKEDD